MTSAGASGRTLGMALLLGALAGFGAPAAGRAAVTDAPDYTHAASWLCFPGRSDACSRADLRTTLIAADGRRTIQRFRAARQPEFDCFYVYPTASRDPTPNSDLIPGEDEEIFTVRKHAARFRSVCRVFAPLYRQTTLGGTVGRVQADRSPPDQPDAIAYRDVKAAWETYIGRHNRGRGVVLIGASQGALNLKRLLQEEIDGKPVQARLIAAYLIGNAVAVPHDRKVGGDFQMIPLCGGDSISGCIVTYASFRATSPPPADTLFGRLPPARKARFGVPMDVGCTNPAALDGGRAMIDSYFDRANRGNLHAPATPWSPDGKPVRTPFVRMPGLLSAECIATADSAYLAISINPDAARPQRVQDFQGDTIMRGAVQHAWGLHTIDVDLLEGDLIALSARQAAAWTHKRRP